MRTYRSNDFYRLLENWEYGVIDSVEFQVQACHMGMVAKQIAELINWLETETDEVE